MSGVTKGQLETQNAELLNAVKQLEKMNAEAMALARRARNDTDEVELAAAWYKRQRDNLVGFLQGYRKDIEGVVVDEPVDTYGPRIQISRVDAFLGDCREDPPVRDGVRRL
jgi:hypothetical protein